MATSGSYSFNPALTDIVLDAFDRCGIRPSALTPDHMFSARRSVNLIQSRWSNKGINLWTVEEIVVPCNTGQQIYDCTPGTVCVLDAWIRNYQLGNSVNVAPVVTTVNNSTLINMSWPNNGVQAGQWISIGVPIAVAGLIVQGFFTVWAVPDNDHIQLQLPTAAHASTTGGIVPLYTTSPQSQVVTVTLPANGMLAGQTWTVHVQTEVGGIYLVGDYQVTAVLDANNFQFDAGQVAGSVDTSYENNGLVPMAAADQSALPQDRIMTPLGRREWAELPSKTQTSPTPTSYWFDRQINPSLYIWPVPQDPSPLELHYFVMRQMQDANPQETQTPDLPYRFEAAFCAALAADLAVKWAPAQLTMLKQEAMETWAEAALEDRERVPTKFQPQLDPYYQ